MSLRNFISAKHKRSGHSAGPCLTVGVQAAFQDQVCLHLTTTMGVQMTFGISNFIKVVTFGFSKALFMLSSGGSGGFENALL